MRDRACLSFVLTPSLCSVTLATANGTAPSSSNNLPRPDGQKHDRLLLHDPYGPSLSLSEIGGLMRNSLVKATDSPTPSQLEEGKVPTGKPPRSSSRRNVGNLKEFILRQIFFCFQMGLPSVYLVRVA